MSSRLRTHTVQKLRDTVPTLYSAVPDDLEPIAGDPAQTGSQQPTGMHPSQPSIQAVATQANAPVSSLSSNTTWLRTPDDSYGLFRAYPTKPSFIPGAKSLDDVSDGPHFAREGFVWSSNGRAGIAEGPQEPNSPVTVVEPPISRSQEQQQNPNTPFANGTIRRTVEWYGGLHGSVLRPHDFDKFVSDVLHNEEEPFQPTDYPSGFRLAKELHRLDKFEVPSHIGSSPTFHSEAGWKEATVDVPMPFSSKQKPKTSTFPVSGLHRRSIVEIIKAEMPTATSRNDFHLTPYKLIWNIEDQQPEQPHERVITEIYNSDAMINEHIKVSRQQAADGDPYETVIAGLMFWSDSTHLADFGNASLWPGYMAFGNQSKYTRSDPGTHSLHHLAYIPEVCPSLYAVLIASSLTFNFIAVFLAGFKIPDELNDHYIKVHGKAPPRAALTQMRRDLFQGVWDVLLDDEFLEAYDKGILIVFSDGITRRVFPRIFTYSADYPEK